MKCPHVHGQHVRSCSYTVLFKVKPGMGKGEEFGYNSPEFFQYDKYSYFDIEKEVVDGKKRVEQPKSGLTEFW